MSADAPTSKNANNSVDVLELMVDASRQAFLRNIIPFRLPNYWLFPYYLGSICSHLGMRSIRMNTKYILNNQPTTG
jgi:hypothetical protein